MAYNLCILQFDRSGKSIDNNVYTMETMLQKTPDADFYLMPEDWLGPLIVDEDLYFKILEKLRKALPSENCLLVCGAQYVRQSDKVISTGAFVTKDQTKYYDKIFPSHAIGERNFISPGSRQPIFSHRGIKLAAIVCVDLFYPELCRQPALGGAQIIFNPANIPADRMDLWQHIGITRAAENTVFLAMANNTNTCYPDGRKVSGRSFVAGPDGKFFYAAGTQAGCFNVSLDLALIEKTRLRWKYLADAGGSNNWSKL